MTNMIAAIKEAMTPLITGLVDAVTEQVIARINQNQSEPRYYTAKQVAELLQVSLPTVRKMSQRGDIIPLHLPKVRGIRYDASSIDSAISERRIYRYKHSR